MKFMFLVSRIAIKSKKLFVTICTYGHAEAVTFFGIFLYVFEIFFLFFSKPFQTITPCMFISQVKKVSLKFFHEVLIWP